MKFLFNVGAEKSGTTWLYYYFQKHPEFYDIGKELNVIQRDDLVPTFADSKNYKKDLEKYFRDISQINQTTGDFTHYEGSTENIFRLFKTGLGRYDIDVVPVYIMRDPIKRAWSSWNMLGGGTNFDMPGPAFFITQNFFQCKYKETVEALDAVFPKPLYFFYEDFFKQENIDLICDELNISKLPAPFETMHNKGSYDFNIPDEFISKFCLTEKNKNAVKFISERFENVPWNLSDY